MDRPTNLSARQERNEYHKREKFRVLNTDTNTVLGRVRGVFEVRKKV
jgi:hypothetical protein